MTHDSTPPDRPGFDSTELSYLTEIERPREGEELAAELFTIIGQALERLGVNRDQQLSAFERSRSLTAPPFASGSVLRIYWGLSNLIGEWSRAPEYQDADGQPRILKIKGAGATFQTLAQRFLPHSELQSVIDMARRSAEVELLARGRIALLGSVLVKTSSAHEVLLAHAIRHIDQILNTIFYNELQQSDTKPAAPGRMERMVVGLIAKERFKDFVAELRPQVFNLMSQIDAAVSKRAPDDVGDATAVVVGMYVAEESDWERIGVDPATMMPDKR
jgi:Family of unknown function (DUF6502)